MISRQRRLMFRQTTIVSGSVLLICLLLLYARNTTRFELGSQTSPSTLSSETSSRFAHVAPSLVNRLLQSPESGCDPKGNSTPSLNRPRYSRQNIKLRHPLAVRADQRQRKDTKFSKRDERARRSRHLEHGSPTREVLGKRQVPAGRRPQLKIAIPPNGETSYTLMASNDYPMKDFYTNHDTNGLTWGMSERGKTRDGHIDQAIRRGDDDTGKDPIPFFPRSWTTPYYTMIFDDSVDDAESFRDESVSFWRTALGPGRDLAFKMFRDAYPNIVEFQPPPPNRGVLEKFATDYRRFQVSTPEYAWELPDVKEQFPNRDDWDDFRADEDNRDDVAELTGELEDLLTGYYSRKDRTFVIDEMFKDRDLVNDQNGAFMSDIVFSVARNLRDDVLFEFQEKKATDIEFIFISTVVNDQTNAIVIWAFTMWGVSLARGVNRDSVLKLSFDNPKHEFWFNALLDTPNIAPFQRSFKDHHNGWGDIQVLDIYIKSVASEADVVGGKQRTYDQKDGWHKGRSYIGLRLGDRSKPRSTVMPGRSTIGGGSGSPSTRAAAAEPTARRI